MERAKHMKYIKGIDSTMLDKVISAKDGQGFYIIEE